MYILAGELEAFQDVIGAGDQSQMLSRLVSRVASLDTALAEGEMRRRALHNQLVELRGNVRFDTPLDPTLCVPRMTQLLGQAQQLSHVAMLLLIAACDQHRIS